MGTSTTSNSAQNSGAAKDDVVGLNGDYDFTIADLLKNDPGGAAKVDVTKQFFFGNITDYAGGKYGAVVNGIPTLDAQKAYLLDHGITVKIDPVTHNWMSFDIGEHGQDFDYMVQIGNKGTWSSAHVDVVGTPPPPAPVVINDAPVAVGESAAVAEDASITVSAINGVLANDSDSDVGQTLKVLKVGTADVTDAGTLIQGVYGDLTIKSDGSYSYVANHATALAEGEPATDTFNYTVTDQHGGTSTATLTLNITGVNDVAKLSADVVHLTEGDTIADISAHGQLTATDPDAGQDTFKPQTNFAGEYGHFSIGTDGKWTYTADSAHNEFVKDQHYTDTFKVFSVDGTETSVSIDIAGTDEKPVCSPHAGNVIASWTFEDTIVTDPRGYQQTSAPTGWFNVADYAESQGLGTYAKSMEVVDGTNGPQTGFGAGEHQWLDTAASPGNIWIQLSESNRTTNIEHDAQLSFSIAKQDLGIDGHTDPNAVVEFWWNYELVKTVKASDLATSNEFYKFDVTVPANDSLATDQLFIKSSGQDAAYQGLAIDHVVLNDWVSDCREHLSGNELVKNWNFEQDNANNEHGFINLNSIAGWNNEAGTSQPMQVQHEKFGFVTGFAADEHQWLDTSASPGNIKIGQDLDLGTGQRAQLTVSVAAENIVFTNSVGTNTYQPDADDHLLFRFNGQVVKDISLADFTDAGGQVDWNKFHDFKVDVTGQDGADHLTIESTGMTDCTDANGVRHGYAGFAVDHVSIQEWVI